MLKITTGDATKPVPFNPLSDIIIPHCCNNVPGGVWGSGFVVAISKAFGFGPRLAYMAWANDSLLTTDLDKYGCYAMYLSNPHPYQLGQTQFVRLTAGEGKIVIANMIAQHDLIGMDPTGRPPVRYAALARCMKEVLKAAKSSGAEIHMPRFCSGLAGGSQEVIEQMVQEVWVDSGLDVVIYDFPQN